MTKQRPVNLQLTTISLPSNAIVSILHRISGIVLFLFIPLLLWIFSCSLQSAAGFRLVQHMLASPGCKFLLWAILAALIYHFIAGIRHLLMDMGVGETKAGGKATAIGAMVIAVVIILLLGIALW